MSMFRIQNESSVLYRSKECESLNLSIKFGSLSVYTTKHSDCHLASRMSDHYVSIGPSANILAQRYKKQLVPPGACLCLTLTNPQCLALS